MFTMLICCHFTPLLSLYLFIARMSLMHSNLTFIFCLYKDIWTKAECSLVGMSSVIVTSVCLATGWSFVDVSINSKDKWRGKLENYLTCL